MAKIPGGPLLDRYYLADLMYCSCDCVRKNEVHWGIDVAKVYLNKRTVRYKALPTLRILRAKGFLD